MIIDNLTPSQEQDLLAQTAERYLAQAYSFEQRRACLASEAGRSPQTWHSFAKMGWTAMPFTDADGGLALDMADQCRLARELGRRLVVEPYAGTVILSGGVLAAAAPSARRDELIGQIIAGEAIVACATTEAHTGYALHRVLTQAVRRGDGYVLCGAKSFVIDAPWADTILVPARSSGADDDERGVSIFAVRRDAPGLSLTVHPRTDGGRAADLTLDGVAVADADLISGPGDGLALLRPAVAKARLFLAAEAVGVMQAAIGLTVEHTASRSQFGQPLAQFQAVQHKLADMLVAMKRAESLVLVAASSRAYNAHEFEAMAHAAKAMAGISGRFVGEQCIQLHGGIGVTDECMASHCLRRLLAINAQLGNIQHSLKAFRDTLLPK